MITWERIFTALSHNSTLPFMLDHLINFYGINNVFSAMLDSRVIVTKDYKEHTFVTDDESLIFNTGYTVFVPDSHYWQVTARSYPSARRSNLCRNIRDGMKLSRFVRPVTQCDWLRNRVSIGATGKKYLNG